MTEQNDSALLSLFEAAEADKKELTNTLTTTPNIDETYRAQLNALGKPLDVARDVILEGIVDAKDSEELQRQFELFNINQAKKDAIRIAKLAAIREHAEDQIAERLEKRPDYIGHRELIEYYNAISDEIESAKDNVTTIAETAPIKFNGGNTNVNINVGPTLDRDKREQVVDIVSAILTQIQQQNTPIIQTDFTTSEGDNNTTDAKE